MLKFIEIDKNLDEAVCDFCYDSHEKMQIKDWLALDPKDELLRIIERGRKYSVLVVDVSDNDADIKFYDPLKIKIAAVFLVNFYDLDNPDFFGYSIGMTKEELKETAVMDIAIVGCEYRGQGLQKKTIAASEEKLKKAGFKYLLATIDPENKYSLKNALESGYEIKKKVIYYTNLTRFVLLKKI